MRAGTLFLALLGPGVGLRGSLDLLVGLAAALAPFPVVHYRLT